MYVECLMFSQFLPSLLAISFHFLVSFEFSSWFVSSPTLFLKHSYKEKKKKTHAKPKIKTKKA